MKNIFLSSLLSCLVVGQISCDWSGNLKAGINGGLMAVISGSVGCAVGAVFCSKGAAIKGAQVGVGIAYLINLTIANFYYFMKAIEARNQSAAIPESAAGFKVIYENRNDGFKKEAYGYVSAAIGNTLCSIAMIAAGVDLANKYCK